jgi:hypothetical protein
VHSAYRNSAWDFYFKLILRATEINVHIRAGENHQTSTTKAFLLKTEGKGSHLRIECKLYITRQFSSDSKNLILFPCKQSVMKDNLLLLNCVFVLYIGYMPNCPLPNKVSESLTLRPIPLYHPYPACAYNGYLNKFLCSYIPSFTEFTCGRFIWHFSDVAESWVFFILTSGPSSPPPHKFAFMNLFYQ